MLTDRLKNFSIKSTLFRSETETGWLQNHCRVTVLKHYVHMFLLVFVSTSYLRVTELKHYVHMFLLVFSSTSYHSKLASPPVALFFLNSVVTATVIILMIRLLFFMQCLLPYYRLLGLFSSKGQAWAL